MELDSNAEQQQPHERSETEIEPEPVLEATTSGSVLFDKAYQLMERFSSTRIGQFVLERGDRVLRIFEDTAKWSLPHDKKDPCLVRPLPWLPFLVLIIIMRQLRLGLSLVALLIGNGPVTAHSLVYFIQTRRRKLRSIRMNGMKAIQEWENARKSQKNDIIGDVMSKLSKIITVGVYRPRIHCQPAGEVFSAPDMQDLLRPRFRQKRPREDDCPESDLRCNQLLSIYANANSDDDSDYMPIQEEEDALNESTPSASSGYSMDTSDENAKDLSFTEKSESKETKSPIKKNIPTIQIKEAEGTTAPQNSDYTDQKQTASAESANSVPVSPKTPQLALDNGQKNSESELGAVGGVVKPREALKPQNEKFFNNLNGHADMQKKSTPGHESAADTKPHVPLPLLSNVVNAIPTDEMLIDAIDDCIANQIEIPTNKPPQPQQPPLLSPLSSPSCSTESSTSSLASFETSCDNDFVDSERDDTPTLNAASSAEDVYLSPIGSPPNFNALINPIARSNIVTFGATEGSAPNDGVDKLMPKPKHFKPEQKTQNQRHQQKQSHQQRHRRNRF
ncbi:uncharacterized protein LOC128867905 isoform X1 [Anastrepha ludens]|uniref:uncharacterized protein LOC128867905 isoform X1 n=1 Tax=Anastrepha ludens TaxID=28586 RepID=UPI0023B0E539|nr:uncharacterized protein LOC128867905 isoform X1 [Anastrepha ludens]XP_053965486.1 uncharacterized protein LOC128867905 isoform X1 [Anastrepha ludens]